MKVEVWVDDISRQLAYEAPDDIEVGDTVIVPVMSFSSDRDMLCTGTVKQIGTIYDGYCKSIRKVVRPTSERRDAN